MKWDAALARLFHQRIELESFYGEVVLNIGFGDFPDAKPLLARQSFEAFGEVVIGDVLETEAADKFDEIALQRASLANLERVVDEIVDMVVQTTPSRKRSTRPA